MVIHFRFSALVALILYLIIVPESFAQWTNDTSQNNLICNIAGGQNDPRIINDGNGNVIVIWRDERAGSNSYIYGQRLDEDGFNQWTGQGKLLINVETSQAEMVHDGEGGAIIIWQDKRNILTSKEDIYVQRIDSNGNELWTPGGVPVCTASEIQTIPRIISDSAGGAFLCWMDKRVGATFSLYAQKVDASGNMMWTSNGVVVNNGNTAGAPAMTNDGGEGLILTWVDSRGIDFDIYAQRLGKNGVASWTSNGIGIAALSGLQVFPHITTEFNNGAIIFWTDRRTGTNKLYMQRVDTMGNVKFVMNGKDISGTAVVPLYMFDITQLHGDELIVTYTYNSDDIYVQKVDTGGNLIWGSGGVVVGDHSFTLQSPVIDWDKQGGAVIAFRNIGPQTTFGSYVDNSGVLQWPWAGTIGRPVHINNGHSPRVVVNFGAKECMAVFVWIDNRVNDKDVYVQRFLLDKSCALDLPLEAGFTHDTNCLGSLISFLDTSIGNITSWRWDFGDGDTSILQNPTHLYPNAGVYMVELIVSDGIENDTVTKQMVVLSNPSATIMLTQSLQCNLDTNGVAVAIASNGAAPYTYSWSNSQMDSMANNIGAGVLSVTVSDNNGCDTIQSIIVSEPLPIDVSIIVGAASCNQANGKAQAFVSGGIMPYTYLWNDSASQTTDTAFGLTAGIYIIWVTDSNGCTISDSVQLTTAGQIVTQIIAANDTFCVGDTATLIATGGINYLWSTGDTNSVSVLVIDEGITTVYVTVSDSIGSCSGLDSILLTGLGLPVAQIVADTFVCEDSVIMAFAIPNSSNMSYQWNTGSTAAATTIETDSTTTTVLLELQITNVCGTSTDTHIIDVLKPPIAKVIPDIDDTTICLDETILFTAQAGGQTYSWSPQKYLNCIDCESVEVTPKRDTVVSLFVIDEWGCVGSNQIDINIDYTTRIYLPSAFSPDGDGINEILYVRGKGIEFISLEIYDRWGERVFYTTDKAQGWNGTYKGRKLSAGVFTYLLRATYHSKDKVELKGNVTLVLGGDKE